MGTGLELVGAELAIPADRHPVAVYLASLSTDKSRRTMRAAIETIARELGAPSAEVIRWGSLRYPHAAELRARLAERFAPATVNKLLAALRGVAREAMRLGQLDPAELARIEDVGDVRGSRLPAGRHVAGDELGALFGACSAAPIGVRDAALLAVLRVGGLRRAELVALDLVDLDRGTFFLRVVGKGNKERIAYVDGARVELEAWLAVRGEAAGALFSAVNKAGTPSGKRMGESSVAFVVQRAAVRAKVAHLSPHDMRRTFVGDLLDAGADLVTVQRLAGHEDVRTTARYDRRADKAAAAAAALLEVPRAVRVTVYARR